ncbi:DUF3180 domain-containing protein [Nocardioides dongkuii]|uniref:DUF3180 domain-containing protein n=1 Tax=Nocardioides dongkuii TaxID=2760089 RepID=UPI0015FC1803|nr:DUF3180 domain-containing protein [Nocardioides dongkuii]
MSRFPEPPPDDPDEPSEEPGEGRLRPTSPAVLAACAVVGLVGGWSVRPVAEALGGTAPVVAWIQPVSLAVVAAIVGTAAWSTWRQLQVRRERLEPQRALNRLALARASAYTGALVAGGYGGYAVSWLGLAAGLADERALRSGLAAVAGIAVVVGALLLERACRVRSDDPEP